MTEIDPIELEIIQETMISIVREMRANLVATAYSSIIYEAFDFSCVLVDGKGQIIAQAEDNPSHIFPVPWSVREMLKRFGDDIRPGDVFLHNDPYTGGTHLNDIAMMYPVFDAGEMVLFPVVRAHWGDVGGTTPGSISGRSTEIFHDGVRLPVVRIAREGRLEEGLFDVLMANMRVPRERRGDFNSTWGTCQVAERRIGELFARYGTSRIKTAICRLLDRAELRTRESIRQLEPGSYHYEHVLDPADASAEPVIVRCAIHVADAAIEVDFEGSSSQVHGAMNAGAAVAATGAFIVLKSFLDPAEPINHGNFRPITVKVPEGSFLNAVYPASCAGSSEVRHAAISAALGAMSKAMPQLMAGDIKGTSNHCYIGGRDARRADPFIFYEYPAGGTGATAVSDGSHAVRNFAEGDFASIQPAEAVEHESALLVERCEVLRDSGGAGRFRGGCGLRRDIRILTDGCLLSISSTKNLLPPFGVAGGESGGPNWFSVIRDGKEMAPSDTPGRVQGFRLEKGDIVSMRTSGGGGYGDPLQRDPDRILADIESGYVSRESAERIYGVVFGQSGIDPDETRSLRARLTEKRPYLRVVSSDPGAARKGRSWVEASTETLTSAKVDSGMACELVDPKGASLRLWTRIVTDLEQGEVRLAPETCRMLGVKAGDKVAIRMIGDRMGGALQ
jgi:N-methylhydantoinase B